MTKPPKCPYCGDRMERLIATDCVNKTATAWYRCVVCDSTSPTVECPMYDNGEQAGKKALALAMRRVEPKKAEDNV